MQFPYSPNVNGIGKSLSEALYLEFVVVEVVVVVGRGGGPSLGRDRDRGRGRPLQVEGKVLRGEGPLVYDHLSLLVFTVLLGLFIIFLLIISWPLAHAKFLPINMFYAYRNISLGAGLDLVVRDEWKDTVGWFDEFTLKFKFLWNGFKP